MVALPLIPPQWNAMLKGMCTLRCDRFLHYTSLTYCEVREQQWWPLVQPASAQVSFNARMLQCSGKIERTIPLCVQVQRVKVESGRRCRHPLL